MTNENGRQSLRARLVSGGAWTFLGRLLTVAAGFAVNALIARIVSADELGAYFLLVSVISLGCLVASCGMQIAVVRLVAQAMAKELPGVAKGTVRIVLRVGLVNAAAVALAVGLSGEVIATQIFNAPPMTDVSWYAAAIIVAVVPLNLFGESFRGFHAFGMAALFTNNTITNVILLFLLVALATIYGRGSLATVLTASVMASVVGLSLAAWFMMRRLAGVRDVASVSARSVLAVSFPLMISGVALFVMTQADLWIIGMFASGQDVALYGAAIRMSQLTYIPLLIGNTMLAPFIAEMYTKGDSKTLEKIIRSASTLSAAFALTVVGIFVLAGESILALAFGEFYRSSYLLLIIISIGQAANVWCGPGMITLINTGHQKYVMYISIAFGALMIVASLLSVDRFGAQGVAVVMSVSVVAQAIFTLFVVRRKTDMWTHAGMRYISFIIENALVSKRM